MAQTQTTTRASFGFQARTVETTARAPRIMSDLAYASMAEWQQNVVRPFAGATGLPPGTVLFTLALFASLPLGFGFAAVPGAFAKNLYSLATGTALSYFAFGGSTVTCLYMGAASYLAMALDRRRCGYVVFAGSFGYLIRYHATSASGESWKAGNIDITGLLMVLTLKVTACALNYMDAGAVRDTAKRNAHLRRVAVEELPNPLEYAGWLMFPCTLVVGPAIEFREYHDWLHGKGHYGGKDEVTNVGKMDPPALRSRYARSLWLVAYSSLFCFVHLFVMRVYTIDNTYLDPAWSARPLWRKFWELHILGQGSRGKYFFCWVWAEAACVASGVGFGGYDEKTREPRWDVATNVKPMGVERAATFVQIPHNWNVKTGMWLRHYVYDRATPEGARPGFAQLLLTQVISGVWHGLYAGYWLFFVSSAVFVHGSKGVYRWQRDHFSKRWSFLIDFPHWALTTVGLNYLCGAFMLVTYEQCMNAWGSVYFLPHLTVLLMVVFSETVGRSAARRKRSAEKRSEAKAA